MQPLNDPCRCSPSPHAATVPPGSVYPLVILLWTAGPGFEQALNRVLCHAERDHMQTAKLTASSRSASGIVADCK